MCFVLNFNTFGGSIGLDDIMFVLMSHYNITKVAQVINNGISN